MTEDERLKLGERRRLIFENVAGGVPTEEIMAAFQLSELEIQQDVAFVAKKLKEYNFRRQADASPHSFPTIPCETWADIRMWRKNLLVILSKCGNKYLSSELILPTIKVQKVDSKDAIAEINHRMSNT